MTAADMRLREATIDDLALVAAISAEGFADDPVMTWVFQDPSTRERGLHIGFTGLARSYFAPASVVHLGEDACTTMWRSPAYVEPPPPPASDEPRPWPADVDERFAILGERMAAAHPHEPHWYLNVIATRPADRGRGLGARALAPVLHVCDVEGMPAYLESSNPRNMTLYRRHGFVQTGEIELPDGPSLYPMWREPGASSG
jgi:ribosomal protein S18 acetylase RimI-like enzyme